MTITLSADPLPFGCVLCWIPFVICRLGYRRLIVVSTVQITTKLNQQPSSQSTRVSPMRSLPPLHSFFFFPQIPSFPCPRTYGIVIGSALKWFACNIIQTGMLGRVVCHVVHPTRWNMHPTIYFAQKRERH